MDAVDKTYLIWQELIEKNTSKMSEKEKAEHENQLLQAKNDYDTEWNLDKRKSRNGSVYY
ncbi:MAG: hypothetical protein LBO09_02460 [Candidatus Peribacteria bacterium]|jgi:hypothetical protein|nr:hypothetical protein [Candidatus Peribacteria bacterium]